MVLRRHHDGHSSHTGDIRTCHSSGNGGNQGTGGNGRWRWAWSSGGLRSLQGVPITGVWPSSSPGKAAVVPSMQSGVDFSWTRPVACHAARGSDDGGGVGDRVALYVEVVPWIGAGDDGGQGAVLGEAVRARTALSPRDALGCLGVFPTTDRRVLEVRGEKTTIYFSIPTATLHSLDGNI